MRAETALGQLDRRELAFANQRASLGNRQEIRDHFPSNSRRREDVGGFGTHCALSPHPFRHFLDEVGCRGDFRSFALRHVEPAAGERRFDLGAGHALRFHDPVSPMLRLPHSGGIRFAAEQNIWRQMRIA